MTDFFRFPHTPHIAWLGKGEPRDDKVLSPAEAEQLLRHPLILEEKVDGANLGFSVGTDGEMRAQNRGQYLSRPFSGQFSRLNGWLSSREEMFFDALGESLMLFGEWTAAVHSLEYDGLPDVFLLFDVFDRRNGRFWSVIRRNALAEQLGLQTIRQLGTGSYSVAALEQMLISEQSAYRGGAIEGIYLRVDDGAWLTARAKLVHPAFVQGIGEHWRAKQMRWNRCAASAHPATLRP